jgi:phage-related protein
MTFVHATLNLYREFVDKLPLKEQAEVFAYINELKQQGHNLRRPLADYLGNGIYELRPRKNRIFYFFFHKTNAILVHAIKKKTNQIPETDLQLCNQRKFMVESSGHNHFEKAK